MPGQRGDAEGIYDIQYAGRCNMQCNIWPEYESKKHYSILGEHKQEHGLPGGILM